MPINRHALRAIRERSGLSVSALAALAAVSQPHLSNIERGRRQASPEVVARLARALKVPVVALLQEAPTAPQAVDPSPPDQPTQHQPTQQGSEMHPIQHRPDPSPSGPPPAELRVPPHTRPNATIDRRRWMNSVQVTAPASAPSRGPLRRTGIAVAGVLTAAGAMAAAPPAQAETYYTGQCTVTGTAPGGTTQYVRSFQAAIVGSIEQGTGKYVWDHYDYKYYVDPNLSSGGSSDEVVTIVNGYDSGLRNPWASPDNHGSIGSFLHEYNWKGAKSYWGFTKVKFHAAFDVPSVPDPHCDASTGTV